MNCLYYNPGSCSLAPHIVLEEIGEPYKLKLVSLAKKANYTAEYLAINPHARVPALDTGEFVLTEVPAVLTYLARRHPKLSLLPTNPREEARCLEWLAWLSSTVHIAVRQMVRPEQYVVSSSDYPAVKAQGRINVEACFCDIDRQLSRTSYAVEAGYSIVDPFLLVVFRWGNVLGFPMERDYRAWSEAVKRTRSRPAVQKAIEQEGIKLEG